ncbi:MAG: polysaccharide biosynthesis protein [Mangrovibacterium sp.]
MITNYNMTHFMMTNGDAIDLVIYVFEHRTEGDLFVRKWW